MNKIIKATIVVTSVLSANCFAAGGYFGGTLGKAELDLDDFDDARSFSFLAGYQANENLAIEFAYYSTGKSEYRENSVSYSYEESVEVRGPTISLMGVAPINDKFELYGRLGFWLWDADYSVSYSDEDISFEGSASEDGDSLFYGFGAQLSTSEHVKLSLEYTQYEAGDEVDVDIDNISFGARFFF